MADMSDKPKIEEYFFHVVKELERLTIEIKGKASQSSVDDIKKCVDTVKKDIQKLRVEFEVQKVKAGLFGSLAGGAVALIALSIAYLKGFK